MGRIKVGGICGKNRGGRIMWEKLRKGFFGNKGGGKSIWARMEEVWLYGEKVGGRSMWGKRRRYTR